MDIKIGGYDSSTRTVPVTFTQGERVHTRTVNAVLKTSGSYDKAATAARVDQVALGVAAKLAAGVVALPEPAVTPADEPAAS